MRRWSLRAEDLEIARREKEEGVEGGKDGDGNWEGGDGGIVTEEEERELRALMGDGEGD